MDLRKIGLASNLWMNWVWFGGEKIYPASLSLLKSEEFLSTFFFLQIYYLLGSFGKLDMVELRETVLFRFCQETLKVRFGGKLIISLFSLFFF
ncbi:unnamed protein product [Prunus brigantina]